MPTIDVVPWQRRRQFLQTRHRVIRVGMGEGTPQVYPAKCKSEEEATMLQGCRGIRNRPGKGPRWIQIDGWDSWYAYVAALDLGVELKMPQRERYRQYIERLSEGRYMDTGRLMP